MLSESKKKLIAISICIVVIILLVVGIKFLPIWYSITAICSFGLGIAVSELLKKRITYDDLNIK